MESPEPVFFGGPAGGGGAAGGGGRGELVKLSSVVLGQYLW